MNGDLTRRGGGIVVLAIALLAAACSSSGAREATQHPLAPGDAQAERLLTSAVSGADAYFLGGSSYTGFTPDEAQLLQPDVAWNTSTAAVVGQVSIRDDTPRSVLLVTKSASGTAFCASLSGLGGTRKGRQDAQRSGECTGGW